MEHDETRTRLRDACEELEDAVHALRWAAEGADEGRRSEVRLSQADMCMRRAEQHLQGAPGRALLFRLGLAARRAARFFTTGTGAEIAERELAHLERGVPRLRQLVEDEMAS